MTHKPPKPALIVRTLMPSLESQGKVWGPTRNCCKTCLPGWVREGMHRLESTYYSQRSCSVLYLHIVRVTSGCISNVKANEVKNHHFASWLGDDPLTGPWVRGHSGVVRWMDSSCSRQGASTGCQETPGISTCDKGFQGMYNMKSTKYYYEIRRRIPLKPCCLQLLLQTI